MQADFKAAATARGTMRSCTRNCNRPAQADSKAHISCSATLENVAEVEHAHRHCSYQRVSILGLAGHMIGPQRRSMMRVVMSARLQLRPIDQGKVRLCVAEDYPATKTLTVCNLRYHPIGTGHRRRVLFPRFQLASGKH